MSEEKITGPESFNKAVEKKMSKHLAGRTFYLDPSSRWTQSINNAESFKNKNDANKWIHYHTEELEGRDAKADYISGKYVVVIRES